MGKKLWITGGVVVGLVAAYTAGGFWGVPYGINWALKKYVNPIIEGQVTTDKITFNPYSLHLNIQGLNALQNGAEKPLLHVKDIDTKAKWSSVYKLKPLVEHLTIDGFDSNIVRTGLSTFNVTNIIQNVEKLSSDDNKSKEEKKSEPLLFAVEKFIVSNSALTLDDKYRKKVDKITDLNFALPLISNFTDEINNPITPKLSFKFNNEPFEIDANSVPFTLTKKTGVDFEVKNLNLPNIASFNPITLNANLTKGTLDAKLNLDFSDASKEDNSPRYLRLKGQLKIKDLRLEDTVHSPYEILTAHSVDVDLKEFAFFRQLVDIGEIKIASPRLAVIQSGLENNIAYLATHIIKEYPKEFAPKENSEAKPESTDSNNSQKWQWNIARISISDGAVSLNDTASKFTTSISDIALSISPLSDNLSKPINVDARTHLLGGEADLRGDFTITPLTAALNVKTNNLSIGNLNTFIQQYSNAHVTQGTLSNEADITLNLGSDTPLFTYKGNAAINNFLLTDKNGKPVANFKTLQVDGLTVDQNNNLAITVKKAVLNSPMVHIIKPAKGPLNVQQLVKSQPAAAASEPADKASGAKKKESADALAGLPAITVDALQITNGRFRYTDEETNPDFNANLTKLDGSITKFTTLKNTPANVDFKGLLNGTPMEVKGDITPFAKNLTVNLDGSVTSLSMPDFSPFSAQYTGYPIQQGQLTFKGKYDIKKDELKSENSFVISHLKFGDQALDAKETLPVGLAVTLLQDRSGQIDLNIPVDGSLNDPQFSVGGIIVKVITNLVTKAVTAPFSLIGSMFGGEDMDLSQLEFPSGSANLSEKTIKSLDVLTKALKERPGIKIQIMGVATMKYDESGLKEHDLRKQMRYAIFKDSTGVSNKLTDAQIKQAIAKLVSEATAPGKPAANASLQAKQDYLLKTIPINSQHLIELANKRATAVRNYLIQKEGIAADRLFLVNPEADKGDEFKAGVRLDMQS